MDCPRQIVAVYPDSASVRAGQLRWFPRGMRLNLVEPADVDRIAAIVNSQRRRSLGGQSPATLHQALIAY